MIRILIISLLFPFALNAQQSMLMVGGGSTERFLDTYTGAFAAYATVKLRADADSCMVIRRSSDNATQLIGFSGNDIDESTIDTHCSSTDCFVIRWCDQTGNGNDATQTTTTLQPKIATSGTIIRQDAILTIEFDGTDDYFNIPETSTTGSTDLNALDVRYTADVGDVSYVLGGDSYGMTNLVGGGTIYISNKANYQSATYDITDSQIYFSDLRNLEVWGNGADVGFSSLASFVRSNGYNKIGNFGGLYMDGNIQLSITYESDQTGNRTGMETVINSYYSKY